MFRGHQGHAGAIKSKVKRLKFTLGTIALLTVIISVFSEENLLSRECGVQDSI